MHTLTFETDRARADGFGVERGFTRGGVDLKRKAVAYVNHGRWVADCPLNDGGSRLVNPDYEFWCVECGNSFVVDWPDKKTMKDITTVLEQRDRTNQNFHPSDFTRLHPASSPYHEPCPDAVTFLAYENDVRGIPIGNEVIKRRYEKWLTADWAKRGLAKEMAGFNVEAK